MNRVLFHVVRHHIESLLTFQSLDLRLATHLQLCFYSNKFVRMRGIYMGFSDGQAS
jgi:hypothetical protein